MKQALVICVCLLFLAGCKAPVPNTESTGTLVETPSDSAQSSLPWQSQQGIESVSVVDNGECAIQIIGIDPENLWGYTLKVELENKSTDKTYLYCVSNAAVNGVQTDPSFAVAVTAGKKAIETITFADAALAENGITEFTDIELTFRVSDRDDYLAEAVAEETVHIYPSGEDKATVFVRAPEAADQVIVDNDYVTVTVTGYDSDALLGYGIHLYLQNKTDKTLLFAVEDASVNGYMADPFWAVAVGAGKCAFSTVAWSDFTLENIGVMEVETVEFLLRAYDREDLLSEDLVSEQITLTPNSAGN